jgi:hypothetical protein
MHAMFLPNMLTSTSTSGFDINVSGAPSSSITATSALTSTGLPTSLQSVTSTGSTLVPTSYFGLQSSMTPSRSSPVGGMHPFPAMGTPYIGTGTGNVPYSTSSSGFSSYDTSLQSVLGTSFGGGSSATALAGQTGSASVIGGLMAAAAGESTAGSVGSYLSSFGVTGSGIVGGTASPAGGGLHPLASGGRSIINSADISLQPMIGYRRPFTTAKPPYSYISLITMAIQVGMQRHLKYDMQVML